MWGSGAPPAEKGEEITTAQVASRVREDAAEKARQGKHSSNSRSRRYGKKKIGKRQEIWTLI